MKRRQNITREVRDGWVRKFEKLNKHSRLYYSFITTQDIKSMGSKSRTPDFEERGQDRDLLSTNERMFFYRLRFSKKFVSIKEQYPLLPLERVIGVAKQLGVRYPTYPYSRSVEVVMTSDFVCKTLSGKLVVYSIKDTKAFKNLSEAQRKNLDNKLKIEKAFWESKGATWYLILSEQIKTIFAQNLEQLFPSCSLSVKLQIFHPRWLQLFSKKGLSYKKQRLSELVTAIALELGISYQESVEICQFCIWNKHIKANLSSIKLRYELSLEQLGCDVNRG
ncbi:TnsA endonuclease N-terminal domain-containing protein [Shewanella mesophila]|uniref:TnsA endonuclease N-terminal domain-containing protein n=1 Tax=Shewanella mesophila TaxID=2864208 RepID=UPI001C6581EB|nr:TnsA endonuclease N-terminal domain-containing protein [Shewanella mesophila]QYJ86909.1 TnsA endonuclease N-terminal domain-containing protein [Shewanella mesophila]